MKKLIFLIASILFLPVLVSATSGACSYHNGVNCSAGADINGKVQCNDGWVNSSVYFYNTDECMSGKHYCTQSEYQGLVNYYYLDSLKTKYDNLNSQFDGLNAQLVQISTNAQADILKSEQDAKGKGVTTAHLYAQQKEILRQAEIKSWGVQNQIDSLNLEIIKAKNDYNSALTKANQKCLELGEKAWEDAQQDTLNLKLQQIKALSCSTNSHYNANDEKCYCDVGYILNGSICMTFTQNCQTTMGSNSYSDNTGVCHCNTGYQWSTSQVKCVLIQTTINTTTPVISQQSTNQKEETIEANNANQIQEKELNPDSSIDTQTKPQTQKEVQIQPKKSNNMFSNAWNFIKNIFRW